MNYSNICLAGVGRYLPEKIVENAMIAEECQLEKEFCLQKIGVRERRYELKLTQSQMGSIAAKEALQDAGMEQIDVDLIINASITFERKIPDNAPLIQRELGASEYGIPSYTVQSGQASFLTALELASNMINAGRYQCILIVVSEITSQMLDVSKPYAKVLYGDGAGAVVVTASDAEDAHNGKKYNWTDSSKMDVFSANYGMSMRAVKNVAAEEVAYQFDFDLYQKTYSTMLGVVIEDAVQDVNDINLCILQCGAKVEKISELEGMKVFSATEKYGLCGAASLCLTLYDVIKNNEIQEGQNVLMATVGDGLTASALVLQYKKMRRARR